MKRAVETAIEALSARMVEMNDWMYHNPEVGHKESKAARMLSSEHEANDFEGIFGALRFKRFIVPWIVAVLTLIPLYRIIFLYSRQLPQEHWASYFHMFLLGSLCFKLKVFFFKTQEQTVLHRCQLHCLDPNQCVLLPANQPLDETRHPFCFTDGRWHCSGMRLPPLVAQPVICVGCHVQVLPRHSREARKGAKRQLIQCPYNPPCGFGRNSSLYAQY